jgi:hypothetical protein
MCSTCSGMSCALHINYQIWLHIKRCDSLLYSAAVQYHCRGACRVGERVDAKKGGSPSDVWNFIPT